jgi:flagellar basal-body rod protein FlgC
MAGFSIFDVTGAAMTAQKVRLNTVASNLANAGVVSGNPDTAYRARMPVFETVLREQGARQDAGLVRVAAIRQSDAAPEARYAPDHPRANDEGYVYRANVNLAEEMANMTSAARSYQTNVEVMNTVKQLMLRTLRMGQ